MAPRNPQAGNGEGEGQSQGNNQGQPGNGGGTDPDFHEGMGGGFDPNDDFPVDGDDSEDPELDDLLSMFADEEDEESEEDPAVTAAAEAEISNQRTAKVKEIEQQLLTAIQQTTLPDTLFGDDFDPSDPASVRTAMTGAVQTAISNSIRLTLQPMQAAMSDMRSTMLSEMRKEIKSSQTNTSEEAQLIALAPVMGDADAKKVLSPILAHLKKGGKSVKEQAKVINSFAAKLSLNKRAKGRSAANSEGDVMRTGTDALKDLFG